MTESGHKTEQTTHVSDTNRPALGFRVTQQTDSTDVAATILRAQEAGFHPYVLNDGANGSEALNFAQRLGAEVVSSSGLPDTPSKEISREARRRGFPGVVWKAHLDRRVDFKMCAERIQNSTAYTMEPAFEPAVGSNPEILVAIPAYNEAETISGVITKAAPYADDVIVVDDGSDDDTAKRAHEAGAVVVAHETNQGYGAALQTAFEEAHRSGTDHLVILDGDGQHDPGDIPALMEKQRERNAEVTIGSRFTQDASTDAPMYRRFGLRVVNILTNLSLGLVRAESRIFDTQSGFRVYSHEAIATLAQDDQIGDSMEASTDILYHAHQNGYDVAEVGTDVTYEVKDASSHNPVSHGVNLIMNLLRTVEQNHPVTILGIPGFVFTLLGIGFGYWTFSTYLTSEVFPLGLAVTSVFFTLSGILACFTAIILHSLNVHLDDKD